MGTRWCPYCEQLVESARHQCPQKEAAMRHWLYVADQEEKATIFRFEVYQVMTKILVEQQKRADAMQRLENALALMLPAASTD